MPLFVFRAVDGRGKMLVQVGKLVEDHVSIGEIIQTVVRTVHNAHGASFVLEKVIVFPDNKMTEGTELEVEELDKITGAAAAGVGLFVVLHGKKEQAAEQPQQRESAFTELHSVEYFRPKPYESDRYDLQIYDALINQLDVAGVGFPKDIVNTVGKDLLWAIKSLLQYILPFHDAGNVFQVRQ